MTFLKNAAIPRIFHYRLKWVGFWTIYRYLSMQRDLKRLIAWAQHKQLTNPRKLYQFRLSDVEGRLASYRLSSPRLMQLAGYLYFAGELMGLNNIKPHKGAAAIYRPRKT